MYHYIGIVGSTLGILGTAALSYDLLKSKTSEDSLKEFQNLQDQIDSENEELTVRTHEGFVMLAKFIGYLALSEVGDEITSKNDSPPPSGADAISDATIRRALVERFMEAKESLSSPEAMKKALSLIADVRGRISRKFVDEAARSQRLRRVAIAGVWLVGIGAVAQLLDLLLLLP